MNFNDLKKLCDEHNNCLEISDIIQKNKEKRHWFKVTTPSSGEFYLDEDVIKVLELYYSKKGLEIEKIAKELLEK
ncbi:hypothetical protein ACUH7Y_09570 [Clostridium beijerinckii]